MEMYLGNNGQIIEKSDFRNLLISSIQSEKDENELILNFLIKTKDEIISLMEMLKR